tara:strand:+ start:297 stop:962 length:666 start_codon:yes stop_codon:yes gene_type:complete
MFNLKYKRTRQWLLFWILTLLFFSSLFLMEYFKNEALNIFLSLYFFFFYPIYCIFCFFRTIGIWIAGPEHIKDGYSQKFNAKLRANQIIMDLENFNLKEKRRKKLEKELSAIGKKYKSTVGSVKQLYEKRQMYLDKQSAVHAKWVESIPEQNAVMERGTISVKIKCPHCHEVGKVRKKIEKSIEETSEKGVIGALIGKKMVTDKGDITKLYCDNCQTPWTA